MVSPEFPVSARHYRNRWYTKEGAIEWLLFWGSFFWLLSSVAFLAVTRLYRACFPRISGRTLRKAQIAAYLITGVIIEGRCVYLAEIRAPHALPPICQYRPQMPLVPPIYHPTPKEALEWFAKDETRMAWLNSKGKTAVAELDRGLCDLLEDERGTVLRSYPIENSISWGGIRHVQYLMSEFQKT